jgi:hypothetical protein
MVANFTFLAQGADEPLKYKEGVSGVYINGIVKNNVSQNLIESTNIETIQDGALTPKLQHHSVFMDAAGDTAPFKADTDSSGVSAAQLEASINERATDLVIWTNTLVSGFFLCDN